MMNKKFLEVDLFMYMVKKNILTLIVLSWASCHFLNVEEATADKKIEDIFGPPSKVSEKKEESAGNKYRNAVFSGIIEGMLRRRLNVPKTTDPWKKNKKNEKNKNDEMTESQGASSLSKENESENLRLSQRSSLNQSQVSINSEGLYDNNKEEYLGKFSVSEKERDEKENLRSSETRSLFSFIGPDKNSGKLNEEKKGEYPHFSKYDSVGTQKNLDEYNSKLSSRLRERYSNNAHMQGTGYFGNESFGGSWVARNNRDANNIGRIYKSKLGLRNDGRYPYMNEEEENKNMEKNTEYFGKSNKFRDNQFNTGNIYFNN